MHVHKVKAFYAVPEQRQKNLKLKCEDLKKYHYYYFDHLKRYTLKTYTHIIKITCSLVKKK